MSDAQRPSPFLDAAAAIPALAGDGWRGEARRFVEAALGIARARARFAHAALAGEPAEALLAGFRLTLDAAGVHEAIPASGAALVVSNHPFGGADALAQIALCLRRRRDFFILANEVAASAPGIGRHFLPLSILGGRDAARKNAATLKSALDHLRGGGLLGVFPAGEVSTWRPPLGRVADGPWSPHVAALAVKAGALVLPLRFFGHNPPWFHLAGALHPFVRTALLPHTLLAAGGRPVVCRAGEPIAPSELAAQPADERIAFLRRRLEAVPFP
jgi:putative hemolysin